MISEECHDLATVLFKNWLFIDSARRYAITKNKEQALMATINARAVVYESGYEKALTENEAKALATDLEPVIDALNKEEFTFAQDRLHELSEQVFMSALQKVVSCECRR
ncbi:unnamed protein product [marine sediment metagenome]|uniref:Uncharacterized protein n=1 Tax=marine sediment metagenome TaxID=412755 RepID=X1I261_9ZZZZ